MAADGANIRKISGKRTEMWKILKKINIKGERERERGGGGRRLAAAGDGGVSPVRVRPWPVAVGVACPVTAMSGLPPSGKEGTAAG